MYAKCSLNINSRINKMQKNKKQKLRVNFRISEAKMKLLIRKANKYHDGNISEAARKAIDLFLIEK